MTKSLLCVLILLALSWTACHRRPLEVHSGRRILQALQGEARHEGGRWILDLELPSGTWKETFPEEDFPHHQIQRDGRTHVLARPDPTRMQRKRTFRMVLAAADNPSLTFDLRVPARGEGILNVFYMLVRGTVPLAS